MKFVNDNGALVFYTHGEMCRIEAWGKDAFRVRSTMLGKFSGNDWALTEACEKPETQIIFGSERYWDGNGEPEMMENATIINGRIKAVVNFVGIISFYRDDKLILREYFRAYTGTISKESRCLKVVNREWKGVIGGSEYSLRLKFESNEGEKIFGMGQYQQSCMELQGCVLEEKGPLLPLLLPKAPDSPWLERHPEVSPWSSPAVSSLRVSLGQKRPLFDENISHMGVGCSLMTLPQPDHAWQ